MKYLLSSAFMLVARVAFSVEVTVYVSPARCGLNNGTITASANGGIPPYSFVWSNGATTQTIQDLAPGDYTVTVTDGLSNTDQTTATVEAVFAMGSGGLTIQLQPDCQGMCTGIALAQAPYGGILPYSYPPGVTDSDFGLGQLTIMGICGPSFGTITVWDANGCPGDIDMTGVILPAEPASITVQTTSPACAGQNNGSMTILMDGPFASLMQVIRIGGGYSEIHGPAWNVPYTISDLPAGDYQLISSILADGGSGGPLCSSTFTGTVPELPGPCGSVSGRVYVDADQDCAFDADEYGLPYRLLTIEPGPTYAITDASGSYSTQLGFGAYALAQPLQNESQLCPADTPAPFTIGAVEPDITLDISDSSLTQHDLAVHIWTSNARPGFPVIVYATLANLSPYPSGEVTLVVSYDPLLLSPSNASWTLPVVEPYTSYNFQFNATVPADVGLLGSNLNFSTTFANSIAETDGLNNTAFANVTITGSYDPNFKEAHTSSGIGDLDQPYLYFPAQDDWIDYTVHFQNTGTDTAFTVVLRDELDEDLDIGSLQLLSASHAFVPSFGEGRELIFNFDDIDLPDSTTDLLGSQGFIRYRIKPLADVAIGSTIENTADIYFDFNPAIVTNTTQHVVSLTVGMPEPGNTQLRVFPNPVHDMLTLTAPYAVSFDVFAVDGRTVEVPGTRSNGGYQLDVRALPAGPYYLRTTCGTARFMKY